jgi:hypothetical protein
LAICQNTRRTQKLRQIRIGYLGVCMPGFTEEMAYLALARHPVT